MSIFVHTSFFKCVLSLFPEWICSAKGYICIFNLDKYSHIALHVPNVSIALLIDQSVSKFLEFSLPAFKRQIKSYLIFQDQ